MIIPSIDLIEGNAVQLIGGREMALNAGDPEPLAKRFRLAGEIAVVDLDAALGQGDNTAVMKKLCAIAPCRVGGGIRDVAGALSWLDAGATKVVMGTAAVPEVLSQLPSDRIVAALDADKGEVVVEGWRKGTGCTVFERMKQLNGLVGGYLVTFVDKEGRMGGVDLELVRQLRDAAGDAALTVAGGITTEQEVAQVDRLGADAQIGMALYTGRMDFAKAIAAPLVSDRPDGLWPTVVTDERGVALGLVYSSLESLCEAVKTGKGVYQSRSRGLWQKGKTSGATQDLLRIDLDCDRDALRFVVRQHGAGFCHNNTRTCWGPDTGLSKLESVLKDRLENPPPGSYTHRLLTDDVLLRAKLIEEAGELADAKGKDQGAWECADVFYFALVAALKTGATLADIERQLDHRALKVTRRPGDAKPTKECES